MGLDADTPLELACWQISVRFAPFHRKKKWVEAGAVVAWLPLAGCRDGKKKIRKKDLSGVPAFMGEDAWGGLSVDGGDVGGPSRDGEGMWGIPAWMRGDMEGLSYFGEGTGWGGGIQAWMGKGHGGVPAWMGDTWGAPSLDEGGYGGIPAWMGGT